MKKLYTFLLLSLFVSAGSMAQNQGGPDAYGYTWKNDQAPGGPAYNWIDITPGSATPGTEITGLADDNFVGPFNLGFTFRYYWTDITRFWVGSNGYLVLQSIAGTGQISSTAQGFPTMPSAAAPNNVVAPMLSDLNFTQDAGGAPNPSKAYFYTNNTDMAVVSFHDVAFWNNNANGWAGANTFQVIFSKADSSITFQYQSQTGQWNSGYNSVPNPLVIGIENVTGTVGLQVSNNVYPTAPRAIKFYYPASTTFSVTDASIAWNNNEDNKGFFTVRGVETPISTSVANVGNTTIAGPVNVTTTIRKASASGAPTGTPLFTGTGSVSNLAAGQDQTITFSNLFSPAAPPTGNTNPSYVVNSSLSLTGDLNPGNNSLTTEMVVIDTVGVNTVSLRYDDGIPSTTSGLGFEGGGVYFKPPFYPVTIEEVQYFVGVAAGSAGSFIAKVFDDSGPNGAPGNMIAGPITVLSNDIITGNYTTVALPQPATITSGGFYVSWELAPGSTLQDLSLAVDDTGPFSFQSYEVLFGVFGEYRSADAQDLMIRATISWPAPSATPGQLQANLSLSNIYPNPATGVAYLDYSLAEAAPVSFQISTITGQVVNQAQLGTQTQGAQKLQLNVNDLPSGVYFCTMTAGNDVITRKLVITK